MDPWRETLERSALSLVIPISKNRGERLGPEREARSPADRAEGMQLCVLVSFPLIQWRQCGVHGLSSRFVPISLSSARAPQSKVACHGESPGPLSVETPGTIYLRGGSFRGLLLGLAVECALALWIYAIWCL